MARKRPKPAPRVALIARRFPEADGTLDKKLDQLRRSGARIDVHARESGVNSAGVERLLRDMRQGQLDMLVADTTATISRSLALFMGVVNEAVRLGIRVIIADIGLDTERGDWPRKIKMI